MELPADRDIVIVIPETGKRFECTSDWTIKDAEVCIRKDHHYQDGSIKLINTSIGKEISTREGKSLAEEIQRLTHEEIETLQFNDERIRNHDEQEFIFTFVNGISTQSTSSVVKVAALDQEIIDRLKASVLSISRFNELQGHYEIIATAMVWDYTNDKVLILANYHTFADIEFHYCFPPDRNKKKKRKVTENQMKLILRNESETGFSYEFDLTSDLFFRWKKEEDFVVLQLPRDGFTMPRIPINLATTLTMKIHAFGYIGHLKSFNISAGEIAGYLAEGFTMNLLSAPEFSGAAIIADGYGRAVGFMGDSSDKKNSQHQSYAFKFDQVILSTNRQSTPTNFPGK